MEGRGKQCDNLISPPSYRLYRYVYEAIICVIERLTRLIIQLHISWLLIVKRDISMPFQSQGSVLI